MMNQMMNYCDSVSSCCHQYILSCFKEVFPECEEHCDNCIRGFQPQEDCTEISQHTIKGLLTILQVHKKVNVLLLTQFLLGSSAAEIKALSLDKAHSFGCAKPYYKQQNGRKQLQTLIYRLIVNGIIKEQMAGTTEKPTLFLKTGNTEKVLDNKESIFH